MKLNIYDDITNEYIHRWLSSELNYYFKFLDIHYKILEFENKLELKYKINKSKLKFSEINEKINEKFKNERKELLNLKIKSQTY